MIWPYYRRCSLTYRRTTCSSTLPTVSAKYPSAQKLSPHRNSSSSGYSFLITRLVPPFNLCATSASHTIRWFRLDDQMYVVLLDTQFTGPPLIHPACFVQQRLQAADYFTSQYAPTIFRYPHQVVLQAVFRMSASLIFGHTRSCRNLLRFARFHLPKLRKDAIHPQA